jgi:hypothetical protein
MQLERKKMNPPSARSYASFLMGCFLLILAAGCGGTKLFPVKGQVVYKGGADASALAKGMVIFQPAEEDMPNIRAEGYIGEDGSFAMTTPLEGTGVRPGKYKVIVNPPPLFPKSREEMLNPPLPPIDDSFRDFKTSGLEINVSAPINDYTITVHKYVP